MPGQLDLFRANMYGDFGPDLIRFENRWINSLIAHTTKKDVTGFTAFRKAVESLLATSGKADRFVAAKATRAQFVEIMKQYAPDGLTEAEAMKPAALRMQGKTKEIVRKIMLNEFGGWSLKKAHRTLYKNLLCELGLPGDVSLYSKGINEESFAFVNLYHWLARRAPHIDYYLGALAYTEMSVPPSFVAFKNACRRLKIRANEYFTIHIAIDVHHTREAFEAINTAFRSKNLDLKKAWVGATMAKEVGSQAFQAAVRKAMTCPKN